MTLRAHRGWGRGVKHDTLTYLEGSLQLLFYKVFTNMEKPILGPPDPGVGVTGLKLHTHGP